MSPTDSIYTKDDLKKIFDLYYKSLVLYTNKFLPLKAECEDLVQDVFINIWESKMTFPDEISMKVYLYKAARNKCYNVIKHKKVRENHALGTLQSLDDDNLFLKQILKEEVVRQLYKAISVLPERKKEIIKLSLRGLKNNEISENLGIKLQTVKTLKSQSYKILREQFKDMDAIIFFLIS